MQPSEDSMQARFLPRFIRYVTWPMDRQPAPGDPFILCVIGHDPFRAQLDQAAATETVDGHGVSVRRLSDLTGANACHIAFVRGQTPENTSQMLAALRGHAILTVTDARAGPERGMIHFVLADGRTRFFIDQAEATVHGLEVSSRLLALALGVRQRRS